MHKHTSHCLAHLGVLMVAINTWGRIQLKGVFKFVKAASLFWNRPLELQNKRIEVNVAGSSAIVRYRDRLIQPGKCHL